MRQKYKRLLSCRGILMLNCVEYKQDRIIHKKVKIKFDNINILIKN
jgi:hypothetical protein